MDHVNFYSAVPVSEHQVYEYITNILKEMYVVGHMDLLQRLFLQHTEFSVR